MSADNYIYISKKNKKVYECTASCVCWHNPHCVKCQIRRFIGQGKNINEALEIADREDSEYGVNMNLWCK